MNDGTTDDRLQSTVPNLQELKIHHMGLQKFPNLQALRELSKLWVNGNDYKSLESMNNLYHNKKLWHIDINDNDLLSMVDLSV